MLHGTRSTDSIRKTRPSEPNNFTSRSSHTIGIYEIRAQPDGQSMTQFERCSSGPVISHGEGRGGSRGERRGRWKGGLSSEVPRGIVSVSGHTVNFLYKNTMGLLYAYSYRECLILSAGTAVIFLCRRFIGVLRLRYFCVAFSSPILVDRAASLWQHGIPLVAADRAGRGRGLRKSVKRTVALV